MPRVTHVKRAQQRYETVPVLGPDGQPVKVPVMRSDGTQKTTRAKIGRPARPVFMTKTVADKTRPLPPERCGKCGTTIEVGDPYKHMSPKSGPYGGRRLVRCESCPTWQPWEYSFSTSARVSQLQHNAEVALDGVETAESVEDVEGIRDEIAQEIRDYAQEKEESADNIESGFGHETEQSAEIRQTGEDLESWADEFDSVDIPEYPEPETEPCDECSGTGKIDNADEDEDDDCGECDGTGEVTPDDPTDDQISEWRGECRDALQGAIDSCPI